MSRDENTNGGSDAANGPRIPMLRPDTLTPYAVWRPRMATYMMRVGIEDRYYAKPIDGWATFVAKVETAAAADEMTAMAAFLGKAAKDEPALGLAADADDDAAAGKKPTEAQHKLMATMVARSRKAYGILYAAIDDDLRELITGAQIFSDKPCFSGQPQVTFSSSVWQGSGSMHKRCRVESKSIEVE